MRVALPAMVPGGLGAASVDACDETFERAAESTRLLRELAPCSAYALCAWDPLSEHRHRTLASEGFSERILEHVNDDFVRDNPGFKLIRTRMTRVLRWRDGARDWNFMFAKTFTAQHYLLPAGFKEGVTACLRLPDGRYTGSLHMSWSSPGDATDERRDLIERFRPLLAGVCDLLRAPKLLADELLPNCFSLLVSTGGAATELPNRPAGPHLAIGGALRDILLRKWPHWPRRRFLWTDAVGCCHRVHLIPCRGGITLVGEEPVPAPRGLTARELEVLHLIGCGASNPQIATRLFVSTRTVSTHVEHILAKLGCASRSHLAARAVEEGLFLAEDPARASYS